MKKQWKITRWLSWDKCIGSGSGKCQEYNGWHGTCRDEIKKNIGGIR